MLQKEAKSKVPLSSGLDLQASSFFLLLLSLLLFFFGVLSAFFFYPIVSASFFFSKTSSDSSSGSIWHSSFPRFLITEFEMIGGLLEQPMQFNFPQGLYLKPLFLVLSLLLLLTSESTRYSLDIVFLCFFISLGWLTRDSSVLLLSSPKLASSSTEIGCQSESLRQVSLSLLWGFLGPQS